MPDLTPQARKIVDMPTLSQIDLEGDVQINTPSPIDEINQGPADPSAVIESPTREDQNSPSSKNKTR